MEIIFPTELKPKVNENRVDRKLLNFPFRKV